MSDLDPTRRFTDRVANYVRYRPRYPRAVVEALAEVCGLSAKSVVADVGSGTGIFAELLLGSGCRVIGVEPNEAMRSASVESLGNNTGFEAVDGTGEATGLRSASVDIVTVAQAFHWFDSKVAASEFARILKPGGWVALVWNVRDEEGAPMMVRYEQVLRTFGTDYEKVNHRFVTPGALEDVFGGEYILRRFPNVQVVDREGLRGRVLSASYVPNEGQPGYEPMVAAIDQLFDEFAAGGEVPLTYATEVYLGHPVSKAGEVHR